MRTLLAALVVLAVSPAFAFSTDPDFADDFAKARECRPLADGRKVWTGEKAYYVQAWLFTTGQSGQLDDDVASVVSLADNTTDALKPFADACN